MTRGSRTLCHHYLVHEDVIEQLFYLFNFRVIPEHRRSHNGPECMVRTIRKWLNRLGVRTLCIDWRTLWENGYIEPFNGKLRDALLNFDQGDGID